MKHLVKCVSLAVGLSLLGAVPAAAQLWFFPDYAVPSNSGLPQTFIAGTYARGLNASSGKTDGFAVMAGVSTSVVSFMGGVGVISGANDEVTLGGAIGVDLIKAPGAPVQLTLQAGVGWIEIDPVGFAPITLWRFPIGLALKAQGGPVTPWIMPRLNIVRASDSGFSDTTTEVGVSGGIAITGEGGFGIHAALDYLAVDDGPWMLGVGLHYVLPGGR